MTKKDKIDFIDDLLMRLEDFTHGEDGTDITISRKYLDEIRRGQELPIHSVSNRRELLIAFYNHIQENDIDHNIPQRIERMVDKYLSNL